MKPTRTVFAGAALALLACLGIPHDGALARPASAQSTPGIDARADRLLRAMSDMLGTAQRFTFHADVTYDALISGNQMIQYGGRADVAVRRPDGLRAEYRGDVRRSSIIINGRSATIHDLAKDVYSVTEGPADLDGAIDHLFDTYGFTVPIADFVYADPYEALTGAVDSGFWVGYSEVDGTPCHHLAFAQESIDWQVWIDAGPRPLPRKLVITYKDEPGSPQYTARLSKWKLDARLSDHHFDFDPPPGADEIEFMPVADDMPPTEEDIP